MEHNFESWASLTNQQVLTRVKMLAAGERQTTAALIGALAELDARRLYLGEGFSSLFTYCTQALHLSEHAAYNRIEAARMARKWPVIPADARGWLGHDHDGTPAGRLADRRQSQAVARRGREQEHLRRGLAIWIGVE
jgi:hypothetical protein